MKKLQNRIVLAGGTGDLGKALISHFRSIGMSSVVLSRSGNPVSGAVKSVKWLDGSDGWKLELEGVLAVVNLCGEPIAQLWTPDGLKRIRSSRIWPTHEIGSALQTAKNPPRIWINMSGIGYYGNRGEEELSESSLVGVGPISEICKDWEGTAVSSCPTKVKLAILRAGVVFQPDSGYLNELVKATKRGMGGRIGTGQQWISWIGINDFCRAVQFVIENELDGSINLCAPNPVRQAELSKSMVAMTGAIFAPPAPGFVVRLISPKMGVEPDLILGSTKVLPKRLVSSGFAFANPNLSDLNLKFSK